MHIVMGATGHVGGATADELLRRGEAVTVVTRDAERAEPWRARGAELAIADAADPHALRAAFRRGTRALLVNPPADPTAGDTDAAEAATIASILEALDGSGLEKVVAVSTYGVRSGERIGDLGTLWRFEEGLRDQPIPAAIHRHAYYMTNWGGVVDIARDTGSLPSMLPADLALPAVAPADLGRAAAERLLSGTDDTGVRYVEGPARYSAADVARELSEILGREVTVDVTPVDGLEETFLGMGFAPAAAASFAGMTRLTLDGPDLPDDPWRGRTTLGHYLRSLASRWATT